MKTLQNRPVHESIWVHMNPYESIMVLALLFFWFPLNHHWRCHVVSPCGIHHGGYGVQWNSVQRKHGSSQSGTRTPGGFHSSWRGAVEKVCLNIHRTQQSFSSVFLQSFFKFRVFLQFFIIFPDFLQIFSSKNVQRLLRCSPGFGVWARGRRRQELRHCMWMLRNLKNRIQ